MLISLIVAMAKNRVIGCDGWLPWHLPQDLARFKQLTLGHHLLMGRTTWESIGKPLPGRTSLVLSRDPAFQAQGAEVFCGMADAMAAARARGESELFVCGGEEVYRQAMPLCQRIHLTELEREVEGDRFFPQISDAEFRSLETREYTDTEPCRYTILERVG